jgi:hypothetical protein
VKYERERGRGRGRGRERERKRKIERARGFFCVKICAWRGAWRVGARRE